MRYFAAFESYALFLYKWKTSVTQIVSPQPTHPTKITLACVSCLCFGIVTQRDLSPKGERGRCVTGQNNAERETKVCVKQMQLRDNEQMCAFISDKLEVFLSYSRSLSPSLSCVKTGFLPSKHVSCFTNNSTGGKKLKQVYGGTLADSAKVGTP